MPEFDEELVSRSSTGCFSKYPLRKGFSDNVTFYVVDCNLNLRRLWTGAAEEARSRGGAILSFRSQGVRVALGPRGTVGRRVIRASSDQATARHGGTYRLSKIFRAHEGHTAARHRGHDAGRGRGA